MNIQHSMLTGNHITPELIAHKSRLVLGGIDLDPASSKQANKVIKAKEYFTKLENGLNQVWTVRTVIHPYGKLDTFTCVHKPASVFINPPGSKYLKPSLSMRFWLKLMQERDKGNIRHAIWVAYSMEQLQQCQSLKCLPMTKFGLCIPKSRIKFLTYDLREQDSPTHANAIIYVPGTENSSTLFYEEFSEIGDVKF